MPLIVARNSCSPLLNSSSSLTRDSSTIPTRCHECRVARRNRENPNRAERHTYEVNTRDGCGCTTQVPFQPKGDRPVYCRECFERNRNQQY